MKVELAARALVFSEDLAAMHRKVAALADMAQDPMQVDAIDTAADAIAIAAQKLMFASRRANAGRMEEERQQKALLEQLKASVAERMATR